MIYVYNNILKKTKDKYSHNQSNQNTDTLTIDNLNKQHNLKNKQCKNNQTKIILNYQKINKTNKFNNKNIKRVFKQQSQIHCPLNNQQIKSKSISVSLSQAVKTKNTTDKKISFSMFLQKKSHQNSLKQINSVKINSSKQIKRKYSIFKRASSANNHTHKQLKINQKVVKYLTRKNSKQKIEKSQYNQSNKSKKKKWRVLIQSKQTSLQNYKFQSPQRQKDSYFNTINLSQVSSPLGNCKLLKTCQKKLKFFQNSPIFHSSQLKKKRMSSQISQQNSLSNYDSTISQTQPNLTTSNKKQQKSFLLIQKIHRVLNKQFSQNSQKDNSQGVYMKNSDRKVQKNEQKINECLGIKQIRLQKRFEMNDRNQKKQQNSHNTSVTLNKTDLISSNKTANLKCGNIMNLQLNLNDLNLNKLNHQALDLQNQNKYNQCIPISSMRQKKLKTSIFFDDKNSMNKIDTNRNNKIDTNNVSKADNNNVNKAETKSKNKKLLISKHYVKKQDQSNIQPW